MDRKFIGAWFIFTGVIVSSGSSYAASFYTNHLDDPGAVYLTQEGFAAHGDGVGDNSAALQQAIDKVAASPGAGVLFIPKGTYRLTKTVYVWPGVRLIGYGDRRPVLTLGENTPGFQEGTGKYMLFFSGGRGFGRNAGGPPQDGGAGTFYSAISNIDIEIGPGNPAAVGIRFHVAQHCYIAHADFRLGSARAGLEDIGNEAEDLHFHGGQYGIITRRSAPGWPILVIDCTFEGQSVAAISDQQAGLTLVRPRFKNVPTAVSIVPANPEELWLSDGRLENITGPALVISDEHSARTQINLQNVACEKVPILASFRESGRTIAGDGPAYVVEQFAHGLHLARHDSPRQIKTAWAAHKVTALPSMVESDIPRLPDAAAWVNVRTLGVAGDGKTDDTAALKEAIVKHRALYLPTGWYCISDTLTLKPDTILIGLHPSATVIGLPEKTPAFQGAGAPKPVIEAPQGGTNIITGIGVYTGAVNPRAVGVKWMAGANSLVNDVRLLGGHGTRVPGERGGFGRLGDRNAWNTQPASLWVTNGGGTFKDIWTPNPHAQSGMLISDTQTSGRVYAMSLEHHVRNEMIVRNASHWRFYAVQFEEEREEGPKALPLEINRCSDLQFANTWFYRVISCFVPFPQATTIGDSRDIRFRNLHCYSNSRVSFDSTVLDTTSNVEVRDSEFAVLDVTGGPLAVPPASKTTVLTAGAKVEKLADGFLNIAGAAVDGQGTVYFADARANRIYRWSQETRRAELVRDIPQQPVQLAFDKAGNLLVIAYTGNGTVLAFRADQSDSEIIPLKAEAAAPRPGLTALLPVNRWMGDAEFLRDSTTPKPFHYLSPDGTTFIPVGRDFTTGAMMWGTKMADVLRAFRLAPAVAGQPFYVTNEAELKTWSFTAGPDGTLSDPKLFVNEGGENVAVDDRGNVYLAAGQILVFDPAGKRLGTIEVPQRPTCLLFGGKDRNTLFITARSSLYGVQVRSGSPNAKSRVWEPRAGFSRVE
ncbi:MAG: SMP-30/gluconolactonase/LRE family protein [Planctomycetes bacterium]|nr:SMP-30/gluconolactonase/LRE family protein [Planctomycetota bacterium]